MLNVVMLSVAAPRKVSKKVSFSSQKKFFFLKKCCIESYRVVLGFNDQFYKVCFPQ